MTLSVVLVLMRTEEVLGRWTGNPELRSMSGKAAGLLMEPR